MANGFATRIGDVVSKGEIPDSGDGFWEAGLVSTRLIELLKDIERAFGPTLNPMRRFERSALAAFTDYLETRVRLGDYTIRGSIKLTAHKIHADPRVDITCFILYFGFYVTRPSEMLSGYRVGGITCNNFQRK